ncbi:MAG: hypothetical protein AAF492_22055, partial [Verrucomicrobiota bacterium]
TLAAVFDSVHTYVSVPEDLSESQNMFLVGTNADVSAGEIPGTVSVSAEFRDRFLKGYVPPEQIDVEDGFILTDYRNPIEFMATVSVLKDVRAGRYP